MTTVAWTYGRATEALANGPLPESFDQWSLGDGMHGITVAHVAAQLGRLPKGFTQWELANSNAWTVAHSTAMSGQLPKGFTQWAMVTEFGTSVAHVAALNGHLPESLPAHIWRLKDDAGKSVWDIAKDQGHVTGDPPPLPMPTINPGDFGPVTPLF